MWVLSRIEYPENINVAFSIAVKKGIVFGDYTFPDSLLFVNYRELMRICSYLANNSFSNYNEVVHYLIIPMDFKVIKNRC